MRYAIAVLAVVGLAVGSSSDDGAVPPTAGADEEEIAGIDWLTDLDAARARARSEGRPLLVVFR